jgi:hypothetical protein
LRNASPAGDERKVVISTGDVGVTEAAPPPAGGGVEGTDDVAVLGGIDMKGHNGAEKIERKY